MNPEDWPWFVQIVRTTSVSTTRPVRRVVEGIPMKLLVLGATGQVGNELVKRAVERGDHVTALVRSPAKLRVKSARLDVVVGSPLDEATLFKAVAGKDAVLSALGHVDLKASLLVTESARALIKALNGGRATRVVIVSSTLVAPGGSFLTKIPRLITRHALSDSAQMEVVVRASDIDWTLLRLVRLTNKPETSYRIFADEPPSVTAAISRKSVAACMLEVVSNRSYSRKTIGVVSMP
jgi:putative NADH-flavin reductase